MPARTHPSKRLDTGEPIWIDCFAGGGGASAGIAAAIRRAVDVAINHLDHFFGRAKAEETIETCWVLRPECHYEKTRNWPSARHWLLKFLVHCGRHAYVSAADRAQAKLEWNEAMGPRGAA